MTETATTIALPRTSEVLGFLSDLRRELRFSDKLDQYVTEPLKFAVRGVEEPKTVRNPSPDTACWSFRGANPGVHLIHFCLGLFKKLKAGADWQGYIAAYAHHELMHACVTPRDLKAINLVLKKEGIPFGLYNLFEDARIEAKGRTYLGFPMAWLDFEELKPADSAQGYFFNLIQNRGEDEESLLVSDSAKEKWVGRVRSHYFPSALLADDFDDMLKLLKEWVTEFPIPAGMDGFSLGFGGATGGASGEGDLEASLAIQMDPKAFEALCQIADAQAGKPKATVNGAGGSMGERHTVVPVPGCTTHPIIQSGLCREIDADMVEKVAERLKMLLAPTPHRERSVHPAKRLSTRAFMAGRPDFYRRVSTTRAGRPIRIVYFEDCSGSMMQQGPDGVSAIDGGIAIAMGLNCLARKGLVTGHIVLHQGHDATPMCAAYALPLPDSFFTQIPSDGGWEALDHAFKKNAPLLQKADYVFCNTDGHICDERVDKDWLERHAIRPIGLYCGATSNAEPLKEWFACALIRDTVLNLLEAMVATLDFSQSKRGR